MDVTFEVLKLVKLIKVNDEQSLNIYSILLIFEVSK